MASFGSRRRRRRRRFRYYLISVKSSFSQKTSILFFSLVFSRNYIHYRHRRLHVFCVVNLFEGDKFHFLPNLFRCLPLPKTKSSDFSFYEYSLECFEGFRAVCFRKCLAWVSELICSHSPFFFIFI